MSQIFTSKTSEQVGFEEKSNNQHHFLTVKQFCATYSWPTESAMRSYIYRADELEMRDAFLRVGRRVLINVTNFFIAIQKGGKNHES